MMGKNSNLEALIKTVNLLGSLADEMVFLGGCATGLLLTDSGAPPIRATLDVDVIVEVASYFDYHKQDPSWTPYQGTYHRIKPARIACRC